MCVIAVALFAVISAQTRSADSTQARRAPADDRWGPWIERGFPFFSSIIFVPGPTRNLTPRGLVLNIGSGYWVGFDTDLLRVAAIWKGEAVTPKALAPGSYHAPDRRRRSITCAGTRWKGLARQRDLRWMASGCPSLVH